MDAVSDTPGWTIAEAIERTSDPDHLIVSPSENASNANQQKIALWDRFSRGELVATGCFDSPTASPDLIDPQTLLTLDWSGPPSSTLNGPARSGVEVINVRVFPVLRAPNAANYLNGLSLTEAFRRYVIGDPEVVALAKRVLKTDPGESAVFLEGQAPGPFVDFHWSLDATSSAIAFRFVASPLVIIGDPLPTPSEAISAVSEVLADRIGALRDVLVGGKVVAFGTAMQTGIEGPIGRLQWIRSGISIDVSRGDLCDGQDHRAVPKWTGLSLRLPDASLSPNQSQNGPPLKIVEVPRKAKAQIPTKEKCRVDCVAWLETMMSNPEIVPRSIDDLWAEAQLKWPNKLSKRAFLKARDDAIANKQAWAWKAPGPKPKSPHS
jgi:hypothetical protein